MGSFLCKYSNFTASFVHVFGSSSNGPYLYMDRNIPILGTSDRIAKSLEYLIKEVSTIPTRIVLSTILWDLRPFRTDVLTEKWNETVANKENNHIPFIEYRKNYIATESPQFLMKFEKDVNERLDEIEMLIAYHNSISSNDKYIHTNIGLRTTTYYSDGGNLLRQMNDIMRNISRYRNITLYDLDLDVWSKANFSYAYHDYLFADWQHPKSVILFQNIDKMLGLQYSLYYYYNNNNTDTKMNYYCNFTYNHNHYHQDHHTIVSMLTCFNYKIPAVIENNNLYLLAYIDNTTTSVYRCGGLSTADLLTLFLGHGDILKIPTNVETIIPLVVGDVPKDITNANGNVFISNDDKYFIVKDNFINVMPNEGAANLYSSKFLMNTQRIDTTSKCFYCYHYFMRNIPNIFESGRTFRLSNDKSIYLVQNLTRHVFNSGKAFMNLGYDFSDTIVVDHTKYTSDFLLIPLGTPID